MSALKKAAAAKARYNLEHAKVLIVEPNQHSMEILCQILNGFGVRAPVRCISSEDAMTQVKKTEFDLIICESDLAEMDGYDFVQWLRRSKIEPNNFTSVIIICGHTQTSKVHKARDCGANFILAKPLTPKIVMDRIVWVAKEGRAFIECESYLGPDRRFHSIGPPPNTEGRRADDLSLEVGDATEPNMIQDDIDALLQPKRVAK